MTAKILTVRIPAPLYSELCISAAEVGVPISTYVRRLIEQEHQAEQITCLRSELLIKLDSIAKIASAPATISDEMLLLSRAIAAHLNPQLVAQVRAKLSQPQ